MKVVILAGGFGTRLSEETKSIPKPMVRIGDKPILWHIMKIYSYFGFNEFVICLGYKGYEIKEWFSNYFLHNSDVTIDVQNNTTEIHNNFSEPWKVTLAETGLNTMTGGRIKRIQKYIGNNPFMLTYGDGVGDIDIRELVRFHEHSGKILTVTAYRPKGKFGSLTISDVGEVTHFTEKPLGDGMWINAGFFVCSPKVFDYIDDLDHAVFEKKTMESLAENNQMSAYKHSGFWQPMDTLRDNVELNAMWSNNTAPWNIW